MGEKNTGPLGFTLATTEVPNKLTYNLTTFTFQTDEEPTSDSAMQPTQAFLSPIAKNNEDLEAMDTDDSMREGEVTQPPMNSTQNGK